VVIFFISGVSTGISASCWVNIDWENI
jgi:hypothetical protein